MQKILAKVLSNKTFTIVLLLYFSWNRVFCFQNFEKRLFYSNQEKLLKFEAEEVELVISFIDFLIVKLVHVSLKVS